MPVSDTIKTDICIIGAGLAGLAATLFAANRGLSCVEVGQTGELNFTSGYLDLLGVHPAGEKHAWTDPWAGLDALVRDIPEHPYARLPREDIQAAFEEILAFLKEAGLPYNRRMNQNSGVLTSLGTLKPTYCVPHTMWNGVEALEKKPPCLLVDIRGLKGSAPVKLQRLCRVTGRICGPPVSLFRIPTIAPKCIRSIWPVLWFYHKTGRN